MSLVFAERQCMEKVLGPLPSIMLVMYEKVLGPLPSTAGTMLTVSSDMCRRACSSVRTCRRIQSQLADNAAR